MARFCPLSKAPFFLIFKTCIKCPSALLLMINERILVFYYLPSEEFAFFTCLSDLKKDNFKVFYVLYWLEFTE